MSTNMTSEGLFTPTILKTPSRKRKLIETTSQTPSFTELTNQSGLLTSTLNESISSKFENLRPFHSESPSLDSNFTYKLTNISPKLGSPERSRILYPNLNPTSKKRLYDFKRASPAKKQLFNKRNKCKDPVQIFLHNYNCEHIIKKIFKALEGCDLYNCSRVSKSWELAVIRFESNRLESYKYNWIINKENFFFTQSESRPSSPNLFKNVSNLCQSTPISINDSTNCLTKGQHLQHCHKCDKPTAIVQQQISQCSRISCGFIICLKCNSCSSTGPKDFKDSCNSAMLIVDKTPKKRDLFDSPIHDETSLPFFPQNNSLSTLSSSGYGTEFDSSNSHRMSSSFIRHRAGMLKSNSEMGLMKRVSIEKRPSPVVPVIPIVNVKKLEPDYEPSSPPKVKLASIGSKKSKKALRRL